jgi:hypothetical protein
VTITLYHGAKHWSGPPQILPAKSAKDVEYGPGFYLTTGRSTAAQYAKGGGVVLRFEVDPNLRLLHSVRISADEMVAFVRQIPRLKHRANIESDIARTVARMGTRLINASALVNLMVNYGVAHGQPGVELVKFYLSHGIDADLVTDKGLAGDETWYVLYNLDKIKKWDRA